MFSRRARLSRADFSQLSQDKAAKRASFGHFSAVFLENGGITGCAAVISKKVEKSAVGRHLLKRRIFAVLEKNPISSQAVIVYAREGSSRLSFSELASELQALFERLSPTHSSL